MRETVAALFVEGNGPYSEVPGIDLWDIVRDARKYEGPYSVVAHPPCQRWGRYATGGPNPKAKRLIVGDDGGCFESALRSVRQWGGVLEHPEATHAYARYGLARPPRNGGWIKADEYGYACCVEQGHYGHKARKATWLYVVDTDRPELKWGKAEGLLRIDEGFQSKEKATAKRAERKALGLPPIKRPTFKDRVHTPPEFRELLISLARSVPADRVPLYNL